MPISNAVYDHIGKTYDLTRKADPIIVEMLYEKLHPVKQSYYLDVGCGSGNYTCALHNKGLKIIGIDVSNEMLAKARMKNNAIEWIQEDITRLSLPSNIFQGAICTLATHHFPHIDLALQQIYRVIKAGNLVIFTSTPEQMQHYWLWHYFPNMMQASCQTMLEFDLFKAKLLKVGFTDITAQPFFISNTLQDLFLQAGKYRPEIYLDKNIRQGISSFAKNCSVEEETIGLKKLQQDIDSGEINEVIKSYESSKGDYLFITATKCK